MSFFSIFNGGKKKVFVYMEVIIRQRNEKKEFRLKKTSKTGRIMRLLRKTNMKNIKKRRFSAKLLMGMLVLCAVFSVNIGISFADGEASPRAEENIDWADECSQKSFVGCVLFKRHCRWYKKKNEKGRCIPLVDKKEIKAANKWKREYCDPVEDAFKNDKYFKGAKEFLTAEKLVDYNKVVKYRLYRDGEEKEAKMSDACKDLVDNYEKLGNTYNDNTLYICDYPHWLTDAGKRKCRHYWERLNKLDNERCVEGVLIEWESSLKDAEARRKKREGLRECEEREPLYTEALYDGPVFDGQGLRGGAEMAQMQLSSSISKQRDLKKLIIGWSKFALEIAAVIAVMALIYAGFRYITDMGDGGGVEAAKKIIIWVVVGLLLILSAYAIVNTVIKARFGAESGRASITINKIIT